MVVRCSKITEQTSVFSNGHSCQILNQKRWKTISHMSLLSRMRTTFSTVMKTQWFSWNLTKNQLVLILSIVVNCCRAENVHGLCSRGIVGRSRCQCRKIAQRRRHARNVRIQKRSQLRGLPWRFSCNLGFAIFTSTTTPDFEDERLTSRRDSYWLD